MQAPSRKVDFLAIAIIAFAAIATLPYHDGISLYDSACYTLAANDFVLGRSIEFSRDIFCTRFGVWLPQAAYISLLGLNGNITWVTTAEFVLLLFSTYYFLRKYDQTIAIFTTILLSTVQLLLSQSAIAMGDVMLTACLNLVVLISWRSTVKPQSSKGFIKRGIIAGSIWIYAFYCKESAVFFLPFLIWLTINSIRRKEHDKVYWKYFWITLFIGGVVTIAVSYLQFDDIFWKICSTESAILTANKDYGTATFAGIFKRWTIWPVEMIAQNFGFGLLTSLALPFLFSRGENQLKFWRAYVIFSLAAWILGSQRLTSYSPIALIPRLWLPVLLPLSIAAAHTVAKLARRQEKLSDILIVSISIVTWIGANYLFTSNQHVLLKNYNFIPEASRAYIFILMLIIVSRYITSLPLLLPDFRAIIIWLLVLPGLWGMATRVFQHSESTTKTTYDLGKEAAEYLQKVKPKKILAPGVFARNYSIYNVSDLPIYFYTGSDTLPDPGTYLLLDRKQIEYTLSGNNESLFATTSAVTLPLELNPQKYGYKPVWKNNNFEVYKIDI